MFFPYPQSPLVEATTSKLNLQEKLPGFRNLHFISSGYKIWAWETAPGEVTSLRFHPFPYQQYICKKLDANLGKTYGKRFNFEWDTVDKHMDI